MIFILPFLLCGAAGASSRRVQPYLQYRRGVVSIWSMFVFLTMPTLYLDGRLTGFAKATKTCPAHKLYWRPLNWKRSLPVLKWTSESEYFLSFENFFADTIYTSPRAIT